MSDSQMYTVLNAGQSPAQAEFEEKRSRFIGNCWHITASGEVADILSQMHEQHPKARHIAYAAIWGDSIANQSERMSDDGEPSGTAGKPILDCLQQQNLIDTLVTVTRYFGGVLLGSGGLIRAYSTAASKSIQVAQLAQLVPCTLYRCALSYAQLEMCKRIVADFHGTFEVLDYSDHVEAKATIPVSQEQACALRIRQTFNATVVPQRVGSMNAAVPVASI
ncbi:MAG: YigZ family protein [Bifidobacterium sp.]|nr:YigZ family protein [Bifidobacterium sp.]